MTWANGDKFEGNWKGCKKHGEGKDTYANGSTYVGHYSDGLPSGNGEFRWIDGSYYIGCFANGLKHGMGKLFKCSQIDKKKWVLYEGFFEKDKRKGFGEVQWSNGSEYKGQFEADERNGKGDMRWHDGTIYMGEWVLGKQHGWGTLKMPNGDIRTGYFISNKFVGTDVHFLNQIEPPQQVAILPKISNSPSMRSRSEVKLHTQLE